MTASEIWLAIGGSTIAGSLIVALVMWLFNRASKTFKEIKGYIENQNLALQALLRRELRVGYKFYVKQGWISVEEKEDYHNLYERYHNLGKNGVMDKNHEIVMNLPTEKPIKRGKK